MPGAAEVRGAGQRFREVIVLVIRMLRDLGERGEGVCVPLKKVYCGTVY